MRALIDTVFGPVLDWLQMIFDYIMKLSVPVSHPIDLSKYFGFFQYMGSAWMSFVTTVVSLVFIYGVAFVVVNFQSLFIKFKETIKWW